MLELIKNEAVKLQNLRKEFKKTKAVNGIDLSVDYGEILVLLGANGAGKTTTLRMISGFLPPTNGVIWVNGRKYFNKSAEIRDDIGFYTRGMSLYKNLSIRESFYYLGGLRGIAHKELEERVDELCSDLKLHEFIDKTFDKLSSGQQQRSIVASVFLNDPKILLLDEVTASLDVPSCHYILELVKKKKQEGKAIIFSTHIMSEAEYFNDSVAMMDQGKVIEHTNIESLYKKYQKLNLTEVFFEAVLQKNSAA